MEGQSSTARPEPARLLVHVGMGKTGSSSIQETLRQGRQLLGQQAAAYLGLMLEYSGTPRFPWQAANGSNLFFTRLQPEQCKEELYAVLAEELRRLGAAGVRQAVWSNEWIFQRHERVLPALLRLQEEGFDLRMVCYARRMDGWLRSAYVQWGIKDKGYRGPVRPFRDWWRQAAFSVARNAEAWSQAFGDRFVLRNYDVLGDVVGAFLAEARLDVPRRAARDNEVPYPALLAAWLVHNTRHAEAVRPNRFMDLWRRSGVLSPMPVAPPSEMLASEADLAAVRAHYEEDTAKVNALLGAQGEPPLDLATPLRPQREASAWEMQVLLLRMVHSLQEEVQELRREVAALRGASPGAGSNGS